MGARMRAPATRGRGFDSEIGRVLSGAFPTDWLWAKARETGVVERVREVNPVVLFWTLVLGFGVNAQRSIASLHRRYEEGAGRTVAYSSFYDRFSPELVSFMHEAVKHGLEYLSGTATSRRLKDSYARFQDLLIQDSTILRLHEALAKKWPAARSRKVAAGVKVATVISVAQGGPTTVKLMGERTSDVRTLRVGPWVKGRVLLVDLGYFKYGIFDRIDAYEGFFVSRVKENADPTVTRLLRVVRGRSVPVESERLRDVLPRLRREVLDAEVEVTFRHREYRGSTSRAKRSFRLIAILNEETRGYHTYLTNIPGDVLTAEEIGALYRARWEVELVFKELKSAYALDELGIKNARAVEALVWTAILTLITSRLLHRAATRLSGAEEIVRFTHLRWARVFREQAPGILNDILRYEGIENIARERLVLMTWVAKDPNRSRTRLLDPFRE